MTIVGAAVIDDVMGIVVLSFVVAFAEASSGMVLVTTMMTPPLLRLAFPRAKDRHVGSVGETIATVPEEVSGN
jgi:Kef-type K+ transport system membrane component KefB